MPPRTRYHNRCAGTEPERDKRSNHNATTGLLRLPPEIRDMIWTLVLGGNILYCEYEYRRRKLGHRIVDDSAELQELDSIFNLVSCAKSAHPRIVVTCGDADAIHGVGAIRWRDQLHIGLLSTCKSIARETTSTIYSSNTFMFSSPIALEAWITFYEESDAHRETKRLAAIRHIVIDQYDDSPNLLHSSDFGITFTGLQHLTSMILPGFFDNSLKQRLAISEKLCVRDLFVVGTNFDLCYRDGENVVQQKSCVA